MKLADEGKHHLATRAAEFIDNLADEFGGDADLTGVVLVAEIGEPDTDTIRVETDSSWGHGNGMLVTALATRLRDD